MAFEKEEGTSYDDGARIGSAPIAKSTGKKYNKFIMAISISTTSTMDSTTHRQLVSPFLRLPFEIRLMIYEYLLFPSKNPSTGHGISVANLLPDFHTYYSEDTNNDPFTLSVRTIDPWLGAQGSRTWRRRSTYHVRTGKLPHQIYTTSKRLLGDSRDGI